MAAVVVPVAVQGPGSIALGLIEGLVRWLARATLLAALLATPVLGLHVTTLGLAFPAPALPALPADVTQLVHASLCAAQAKIAALAALLSAKAALLSAHAAPYFPTVTVAPPAALEPSMPALHALAPTE
eukprot:6470681-Prymnesium_polylepis.1